MLSCTISCVSSRTAGEGSLGVSFVTKKRKKMEDKGNSYAENLVFQKKVPSPLAALPIFTYRVGLDYHETGNSH